MTIPLNKYLKSYYSGTSLKKEKIAQQYINKNKENLNDIITKSIINIFRKITRNNIYLDKEIIETELSIGIGEIKGMTRAIFDISKPIFFEIEEILLMEPEMKKIENISKNKLEIYINYMLDTNINNLNRYVIDNKIDMKKIIYYLFKNDFRIYLINKILKDNQKILLDNYDIFIYWFTRQHHIYYLENHIEILIDEIIEKKIGIIGKSTDNKIILEIYLNFIIKLLNLDININIFEKMLNIDNININKIKCISCFKTFCDSITKYLIRKIKVYKTNIDYDSKYYNKIRDILPIDNMTLILSTSRNLHESNLDEMKSSNKPVSQHEEPLLLCCINFLRLDNIKRLINGKSEMTSEIELKQDLETVEIELDEELEIKELEQKFYQESESEYESESDSYSDSESEMNPNLSPNKNQIHNQKNLN